MSEKDDMANALRISRALEYLRPYLESGTFSAPDWAIHLASILTGGEGCGAHDSQAQPASAAEPVGRVHIQLHHDCPSMRNVEFLEDIELPPGTHLLYTNSPEPARDAKRDRRMFIAGWKVAAEWARRPDLISDIGSPAWESDMKAAMAQESGE